MIKKDVFKKDAMGRCSRVWGKCTGHDCCRFCGDALYCQYVCESCPVGYDPQIVIPDKPLRLISD